MSEWIGLPPENEICNWYGFVYKITNLNAKENEKKYYIGCKKFFSKTKKPPLKNKKRKRTIFKESDYKTYYGSSEELKKNVEKYGKDSFKREILKLFTCQWQLKYEELIWQIKENEIIDPSYFIGIINLRIGKIPQKLLFEYSKKD